MIPFLFPVGAFLALILVWLFFRSGGYKRRPLDAPPGPDFRFTGERFLDPPSGEMLRHRRLADLHPAPQIARVHPAKSQLLEYAAAGGVSQRPEDVALHANR